MNQKLNPGNTRLTRLIALIALAVATCLLSPATPSVSPAAATATVPSSTAPAAATSNYTLVLGSSTVARSSDQIHALRPRWVIDAKGKRNVDTLPDLINYWVARRGEPRMIIVGLGFNPNPAWKPKDFAVVQKMLPNSRIVFITPYRTHRRGEPSPRDFRRTSRYAWWMASRSNTSPTVCVAPWRDRALGSPRLISDDHQHPSARGEKVFARIVVRAANRCNKHPVS